jgi:hypothetical protein
MQTEASGGDWVFICGLGTVYGYDPLAVFADDIKQNLQLHYVVSDCVVLDTREDVMFYSLTLVEVFIIWYVI